MKWVIIKFFSSNPGYKVYIVSLMRFIDDLFGGWSGTYRQFSSFLSCFNSFGKTFGIVFDKKQFGDTVNFLDVLVSNSTGVITTDLYSKPTDAHRYLHNHSFHPKHTFIGILFSQMRRAVDICSTPYLRDFAIYNMMTYFLNCGYKNDTLQTAKLRALGLDRHDLLNLHRTLENLNLYVLFYLTVLMYPKSRNLSIPCLRILNNLLAQERLFFLKNETLIQVLYSSINLVLLKKTLFLPHRGVGELIVTVVI